MLTTTHTHTTLFVRIVLIVLFVSTALIPFSAPVMAADQVPLRGHFTGVGNQFTGNFTHLGRFTGVLGTQIEPTVWTAANGDTVTNVTTSFELDEDTGNYVQKLEITGGTGRFANATGSATVTGTINSNNGAYDGWLEGTISRPNH